MKTWEVVVEVKNPVVETCCTRSFVVVVMLLWLRYLLCTFPTGGGELRASMTNLNTRSHASCTQNKCSATSCEVNLHKTPGIIVAHCTQLSPYPCQQCCKSFVLKDSFGISCQPYLLMKI